MNDTVKFIFKTLIKVPIIIFVAFFAFNIFSWVISYFKLVSASYTVMQVGLENNFIPAKEQESINKYLDTLNNAVMTNVRIDGESSYGVKRQYGKPLTVGVSAQFKFVWPLQHYEQYEKSSNPEEAFGKELSMSEIANKRKNKETKQNMQIVYTIPGLRYYPDLAD